MKKFFCFLSAFLILACTTGVHAQVLQSTPISDTLNNVDTSILTLSPANGYYRDYTAQVVATKVSGTPSATIYLQGSLDNATWFNIDSLVVANVAGGQTAISKAGPSAYYYYRYYMLTTGTQKFYVNAYLWRKE